MVASAVTNRTRRRAVLACMTGDEIRHDVDAGVLNVAPVHEAGELPITTTNVDDGPDRSGRDQRLDHLAILGCGVGNGTLAAAALPQVVLEDGAKHVGRFVHARSSHTCRSNARLTVSQARP